MQALYLPSSKWVPWQEDKQCLATYQHRLQTNQVSGEGNGDLLARRWHVAKPYAKGAPALALPSAASVAELLLHMVMQGNQVSRTEAASC